MYKLQTIYRICFTLIFIISSQHILLAENKALVGGRLIDGYGNRPLDNSVILIKGNVIEQLI